MLDEATSAAVLTREPDPAPGFETLPDIARKFRCLAMEIGATGFHVFLLGPKGEQARLVPCMDADYPGISEVAGRLSSALSRCLKELLAHGIGITTWRGSEANLAAFEIAEHLDDASFAERVEGIVFSVTTERGQQGLVIFTGTAIPLDPQKLLDAHLRCHGLFGVIASLRLPENGQSPIVSRRELECLKLTANGLTSDEIARKLRLSVHTANQYLANTAQKLNAVNRVHAVAKALRTGLID